MVFFEEDEEVKNTDMEFELIYGSFSKFQENNVLKRLRFLYKYIKEG